MRLNQQPLPCWPFGWRANVNSENACKRRTMNIRTNVDLLTVRDAKHRVCCCGFKYGVKKGASLIFLNKSIWYANLSLTEDVKGKQRFAEVFHKIAKHLNAI